MASPLSLAAETMSALVGHVVAGQAEALGEISRRDLAKMRAIAARCLRRHPEVAARFDEDDAVQSTLLKLLNLVGRGGLSCVDGEDAFWGLFRRTLRQRVVTEGSCQCARKRGGSGARRRHSPGRSPKPWLAPPLARRSPVRSTGIHQTRRPSIRAIAAETIASLMRLLDPESAQVAALWLEECTLPSIAEQLGMPLRTVERRVRTIRILWLHSGLLDQPE